MIQIKNLTKTYNYGKQNAFTALNNIDLTIGDGESVAIVGQSGAGKTTLLNILRGSISITKGEVHFDDIDYIKNDEKILSAFRRENIANIYQDYFLIDELNVVQNIELPLCIKKTNKTVRIDKCADAIKKVGLEDLYRKKVADLSGGEKQRVAIARAIVCDAKFIFADEPTGALDVKNSKNIMDLLFELNSEGKTLVYVTHEPLIADRAQRIITISDGVIVDEKINNNN